MRREGWGTALVMTYGCALDLTAGSMVLAALTEAIAAIVAPNNDGQLGDGTNTERHAPAQVAGAVSGGSIIAAGSNRSLAVKSDGTLWDWGYNADGELGLGNTTNALSQPRFLGSPASRALRAGAFTVWLYRLTGATGPTITTTTTSTTYSYDPPLPVYAAGVSGLRYTCP